MTAPPSPAALLTRALGLHQAGRLEEAETLYRRVLAAYPDQPDALNLLGVVAHQTGRLQEAADLIGRAVDCVPGFAAARNNLGTVFQSQGRLKEAEATFRRALALDEAYGEAWVNLGAVLQDVGRPAEAAAAWERALALDPADAATAAGLAALHHRRARALDDQGRGAEAEAAYRQALARTPDFAEALSDLGDLLRRLGRCAEAEACFRRAVDLKPDLAVARANLGAALADRGDDTGALACARAAIALDPALPEAHRLEGNTLLALDRPQEAEAALVRAFTLAPEESAALVSLGAVLERLGRLDEAEACLTRALAARDADADAWSNLGKVLESQGRPAAALTALERALTLAPELAQARLNRGLLRLARGELAEGWTDYPARFAVRGDQRGRRFGVPEWQGEDLAGLRLLVWREQGLGDELMFATVLADLIRRARSQGGTVVIECDRRLVPLFARSFPHAQVRSESDDPADVDRHVPAGTLPRFLRPDLARFRTDRSDNDQHSSLLVADPEQIARWRERLAALPPGPKVGLCWRSRLTTGGRGESYRPLAAWAPVLTVPGVTFVNLQYDRCDDALDAAEREFDIAVARWPDVDLADDLDAVAALMAGLDLVVTAPTAVGELAAALGVATWRLSGGSDWTRLGTAVRPWWPTVRPFQSFPGEGLEAPLRRMGETLRTLVAAPAATLPPG